MHNKLKKIKIAIFISGRGSNMESLIKSSENKKFPALVSVIISNNELANGVRLAKNYNIPVETFDKKKESQKAKKSIKSSKKTKKIRKK